MELYQPSRKPFQPEAFAALFQDPPAEYRGAPFWSLNGTMDRQQLEEQIERFDTMGMGGVHAHVRTGLRTPYLGPEFMAHMNALADKQRSRGKLLWLYDEDRWPSGFAGGLVTKDHPEFRRKHLVLTCVPNGNLVPPSTPLWHIQARRNDQGTLLARYALVVDGARLASMRRLRDNETVRSGEVAWYAYLETTEVGTWFNNAGYVDALNPAALEKFADVTYDAYATALAGHLGTTVPAIFTDEPQLSFIPVPETGAGITEHLLTWTGDLADTYRQRFGLDVFDDLPLVVWDQADGSVSPARWRYHDHRSERFAAAYAGTLGRRARGLGLALTGHMMSEDRLEDQEAWNGESMRSYPHFDIPGIDLLCDDELPTTAKQAVSVARQQGQNAVLSELYGVSGWPFDFTSHKRQGDWQAALGITVRVHHLSWMTMAGEAKRDYPAAIDWHSPWWKEYRLVEDHFSRLNTALSRGKALVRVGVIHPVESTWLHYGPRDGSGAALATHEALFQDLAKNLIENLLDFDFTSEALIPLQHLATADATFAVGQMAYDVVVLPGCQTLRATTLQALRAFADRGGKILVVGDRPRFVEGTLDHEATAWLGPVPALRVDTLVAALEPVREMRAVRTDGSAAVRLYSQLRVDGDARWFFVCDAEKTGTGQGRVRLEAKGTWDVERYDTVSGRTTAVASQVTEGWTRWFWDAYPAGSELVRLTARQTASAVSVPDPALPPQAQAAAMPVTQLAGPFAYHLEEPNVLLLDRAEFRLGGGAWEGPYEVLRLDNVVRERLGLPPVHGDIAQPWSEPEAPVSGTVDLRFAVHSDVDLSGVRLALEQRDTSQVTWDGKAVPMTSQGFWVDECLETITLPPITVGTHELVVTQQVRRDTTREWMYLLGDFGVSLDRARRHATLTKLPATLGLGDLVGQGLPLFGGNVVLQTEFTTKRAGAVSLDVGPFPGPLVKVTVGKASFPVAFPPYVAELGHLPAGTHRCEITLFGNRHNCFGPVHLVFAPGFKWLGPDCYRTKGNLWSDAWQLRATGLASPPGVLMALS